MFLKSSLALFLLLCCAAPYARDSFPLDRPYPHRPGLKHDQANFKNLGTRSDLVSMLERQSAVRNQGARGTCSIFSALSTIESLYLTLGLAEEDIDLSEQWMAYLTQAYRNSTQEGSWASYNWFLSERYGVVTEETLPYESSPLKNAEVGTGLERCGHLTSQAQKVCLAAHYDPALLRDEEAILTSPLGLAYEEAQALKPTLILDILKPVTGPWSQDYRVNRSSDVRRLLDRGIPVVLELDVHYGAWNHPLADQYGIGLDRDQWAQGIVSYAEPQSVDRLESNRNRAGHSVVLVGYDDQRVVEKTMKMNDGTTKTFTYRGVYYFKNSWGTTSFGADFEVDGINYPGYGLITYKYANELGSFFRLPHN